MVDSICSNEDVPMPDRHMRPNMTAKEINEAIELVRPEMQKRLKDKGWGAFASIHEVLGVVNEEHDELIDAVRDNDLEAVEAELMDIAIPAIFAIACIRAGKIADPGKPKRP